MAENPLEGPSGTKAPSTVQTLDRALRIIELLASHGQGYGVTEIGEMVGLHKSTVHRLLNFLVVQGYIEKDENRPVYTLGLKFIELASLRLNQVELKTEALPYLHKLSRSLGQPVHLAILQDGAVVYIEKIEPQVHLRMYSQIGKRIPIYCSALGKSLVSDLAREDLLALARKQDYQAFTHRTRVHPEDFVADVELARQRGWSLDDEEHELGIRCVGAPVRDFTGRIVAAVSASGTLGAMRPESEATVSRQVKETAEAISRRMGWIPGR